MELGWSFQIYEAVTPKSFGEKKLLYFLNLVLGLGVELLVRFHYGLDDPLPSLMISALLAVLVILSIETKGGNVTQYQSFLLDVDTGSVSYIFFFSQQWED